MNKLSNYVASVGLAAMIGCNSNVPADQGLDSNLTACQSDLAGYTTGYSGDFNADFNANIMRPYGANLTAVSTLDQCLSYVAGFEQLPNPENKEIVIGEGPSVMVGEDDMTVAYRDLVITEANLGGAVTSYLNDAAWAKEHVMGPMDAYVCQSGGEYWRADSADPVNMKVRTMYVTGDKVPGMIAAQLVGKYGVEDANEELVNNTATLIGVDLSKKGYIVSAKDCPEDTQ